ncbi:MAG: hypothetical protein JNK05_09935 [Myxococcales bacterium]|nr:hypothetical protein [Myxococcales bacterium]
MIRFEDCTPEERDRRALDDARRLDAVLAAGVRLERDIEVHRALFARGEDEALSATERTTALHLFDRAVDLSSAANAITRFHMGFVGLDMFDDPVRHGRHFALANRAYFRRLALGMNLCKQTLGKSAFEVLLEEGSPDFGIGPGQWSHFKWNVLHVEHLGRAFAARQHRKLIAELLEDRPARDDVEGLLQKLDDDWTVLRPYLADEAPGLLVRNAFEYLKSAGHALLLPVQTEVAGWLGDTRVYRDGGALISAHQIERACDLSLPGDILFERRNWYLSNIGLPGFWPHAALWLGSPSELGAFLDDDASVRAAYGGSFTEYLRRHCDRAWASYAERDDEGHERRVIEAVSEGVVFATAEHTLHADYAAALRPKRTKLDVARAIEQAFSYWGRPYDFDFDFFSDQSLVCSELVSKSWEPRPGIHGIEFPLESVFGRRTLSPNSMIAHWDASVARDDAALAFAWFLDGRESREDAVWAESSDLRASHRRPKWDLVQA